MIRTFKWWWAWDYEEIENWLENMEKNGLRLIGTNVKGLLFSFEKCKSAKARYCIDYQSKLTPEYLAIINDDGWQLYQIGLGWYILRKEYEDERPDLYTDFESLIARNKALLAWISIALIVEIICIANMIWSAIQLKDTGATAVTAIFSTLITAFFMFIVSNLYIQIKKFSKKE